MTIYILEMLLSLSAIIMALLLFRARKRVEYMSEGAIAEFSPIPHLKNIAHIGIHAVQEVFSGLSKGALYGLAFFAKHAQRFSTRAIAQIEKRSTRGEK